MEKIIWIINQYASHLETRHMELAKSFSSQGYKVAVITSSFHHGKHEYLFDEKIKIIEKENSVFYVYLHSGPRYSNNGKKRIFNMLDFCRLFMREQKELINKIGKPNYIIASSAPPFVWEIGYSCAKKYKAKFIAEFRDIWPLSLIEVQGVKASHPLVKILGVIEKRAYKHADAIVSTMPYASKHIDEVVPGAGKKSYWMANGINMEEVKENLNNDNKLPEELENYLSSNWCCVYIGSIVKSECVDYLLSVFKKVKDPQIFFAVIGNGHEKEHIQQLAKEIELKNVRFFPAIEKQLIPKALQLSRACIAAVHDFPIYKYGLSMNKLNDYLASGKPTIFVCSVDNVVQEAHHFSIPEKNEDIVANTIESIAYLTDSEIKKLRDNAIDLIKRDYDYRQIGKKYVQMMERLV